MSSVALATMSSFKKGLVMNTLNKNITSRFFATESGYVELRVRWAKLMQDKEARKSLQVHHHILYAVLMGRDWRKGFTSPKHLKESSCEPLSVIRNLSIITDCTISKQKHLKYSVLGEIINHYSGYRAYHDKTADNPFYGLLSDKIVTALDSVLNISNWEGYLPLNGYKEVSE